jgi:crotonobetainyl-CoA:carnitine CoA-transferase CaiB-like acyl-CoA transferase
LTILGVFSAASNHGQHARLENLVGGSLSGFRVLDLGRAIAAPYCAMLLAAEGAEVIKVEPLEGDSARLSAPMVRGRSMYFSTYNQGKRSLSISFRSAAGREILKDLALRADVIVQNFRPGTMAAMGLAAEELWKENRGLVITSISGFGADGPLRSRLGIDGVAQAMSGVMHLTGDPLGPPMMPGAFIADTAAGSYAALGTSMALLQRERTGRGTTVDVTLIDAAVAFLGLLAGPVLAELPGPMRHGNRDPIRAPANVFPTRDGHVFLNAASEKIFARLIDAMQRPDIPTNPLFADWDARMANVEALEREVSTWTSQFTMDELAEICEKVGIPCGPVNDVPRALSTPGLAERGMIRSYDMPGEVLKLLGVPVNIGADGPRDLPPPPELGEHSLSILRSVLEYDEARIRELVDSGAVHKG